MCTCQTTTSRSLGCSAPLQADADADADPVNIMHAAPSITTSKASTWPSKSPAHDSAPIKFEMHCQAHKNASSYCHASPGQLGAHQRMETRQGTEVMWLGLMLGRIVVCQACRQGLRMLVSIALSDKAFVLIQGDAPHGTECEE